MRRFLAVVVAALLAAPAVALAEPAPEQEPTDRIRLASQTPWVGPGEEFVLRLFVTSSLPATEAEIAVAVYRGVTRRSEFAQTLDGRPRGVPLVVTPSIPLAELDRDAAGATYVRLPVQDPEQPRDRSKLHLASEGVYPVRVELREPGGGRPLASLATHLVHTRPPQEGGFPLRVALVLPVHAPLALEPDGSRRLAPAHADALAEMARSLDAHPGVPLTLLPTPETLQALAASPRETDRETLASLTRSLEGRQVAPGAYVPIALPAFADAQLGTEVRAQLATGSRVLERLLGAGPEGRTWVAQETIDEESVDLLRQHDLDRLVVPEPDLAPVDLELTLAQPFELEMEGGRGVPAVSADASLGAHFRATEDPVLAAHQMLADLAVVYRERPSRAHALVALPPRSWRPTRAFLDTLLGGLAAGSVVAPATVDAVFDSVPPASLGSGSALVRRLVPAPSTASLPAGEIRAARARLRAFSSMLSPGNGLGETIEELLLAAEGTGLRSRQQRAYLRGMQRRIESETALIQVPGNRSVTLTARTGEIPVTILSRAAYPVRLQIQVASDKLAFPGGAVRDVSLTRRNTTERFSVEARASGAFPLRVRLVSPEGGLLLGTSRFTVRSTAASGVGVLLSAGAGAFLLVWWGRHLVRGRRNRRLVPA